MIQATLNKESHIMPEHRKGILDPFRHGNNLLETQILALETVRGLVPVITNPVESALVEAIKRTAHKENRSMSILVEELLSSEETDNNVRALGETLETLSKDPLGSLIFAR